MTNNAEQQKLSLFAKVILGQLLRACNYETGEAIIDPVEPDLNLVFEDQPDTVEGIVEEICLHTFVDGTAKMRALAYYDFQDDGLLKVHFAPNFLKWEGRNVYLPFYNLRESPESGQ